MSFNPDADGPLKRAQEGALCYVLTTGKCDLRCDYCGGSFPEYLVPSNIKYTIRDLQDFLSDVKELVIAFYGGEPPQSLVDNEGYGADRREALRHTDERHFN
jgi:sulfatase maturation enzyme AslB (radical SAM superfamily)